MQKVYYEQSKWKDEIAVSFNEDIDYDGLDKEDRVWTCDDRNSTVWVYFSSSALIRIDLKGKLIENVDVDLPELIFPTLEMVNDTLHIIGFDDNEDMYHIEIDTKTQNVRYPGWNTPNTYTLSALQGEFCYCDGLLHLKSTNQLYFFGSLDSSNANVLCRYSLENQRWESLWPSNLNEIGMLFFYSAIVTSEDEKHIFVIGGATDYDRDSITDIIAVYNVERNVFMKCSIKLPSREHSIWKAVILRDRREESLLTFGFIGDLFASPEFRGVKGVPMHIMNLISQWICIEYVHILQLHVRDGGHLRINVACILQSLEAH